MSTDELKFRNRDHVVDRLVNRGRLGAAYDRWKWKQILADLDAAGYAVVAKPVLLDRGGTGARPQNSE